MDPSTIMLRFLITFVFALIFGIERQKSHKPIGFGTFLFVSVGSCALAITSINLSPDNPIALLGAIVTGIGFLGAGALIRTTDKIFGFTTAAAIWAFAIFGLAIGSGEYLVGFSLYAIIIIVIVIDKYLEKEGIGSYQRKLVITTNNIINEKEITNNLLMSIKKFKRISVDIDKKNSIVAFTYLIEGSRDDINKLPKKLFEKPWLQSCRVE